MLAVPVLVFGERNVTSQVGPADEDGRGCSDGAAQVLTLEAMHADIGGQVVEEGVALFCKG
eukprot:7820696-Alexandrium_andersonii.AAC.1